MDIGAEVSRKLALQASWLEFETPAPCKTSGEAVSPGTLRWRRQENHWLSLASKASFRSSGRLSQWNKTEGDRAKHLTVVLCLPPVQMDAHLHTQTCKHGCPTPRKVGRGGQHNLAHLIQGSTGYWELDLCPLEEQPTRAFSH